MNSINYIVTKLLGNVKLRFYTYLLTELSLKYLPNDSVSEQNARRKSMCFKFHVFLAFETSRTGWVQCLLFYNFYINSCSEQPDDRERIDVTTSSRVTVSHKRSSGRWTLFRTRELDVICVSVYTSTVTSSFDSYVYESGCRPCRPRGSAARVAPGAGHVGAGERRSLTARDVRARARPARPPADQFSLESPPPFLSQDFPGAACTCLPI